jgi:hypothetical protein
MEQSPSYEANSCSATRDSQQFCGIHRFISVFTKAHCLTLCRVRWIQTTFSHPVPLTFILIITFHLLLGLPCGSFFQDIECISLIRKLLDIISTHDNNQNLQSGDLVEQRELFVRKVVYCLCMACKFGDIFDRLYEISVRNFVNMYGSHVQVLL